MPLGIIGTGAIASAMVTGLSSSASPDSIRLSPRNLAIATDLADRFSGVSIGASNQDVLDSCETVIIAVRPTLVRSVLSELNFRPDHHVISVVSALSLQDVSRLVAPATRVTRAVPLPSTAKRIGPTAIYPPDPLVRDVFAAIGTVFELESEDDFEAFCATTATIAFGYAFLGEIASWLSQNNVPEAMARDYVARMFFGVTSAAVEATGQPFELLASQHATAGGINERFLKHMIQGGAVAGVADGLNGILQHIRSASRQPLS